MRAPSQLRVGTLLVCVLSLAACRLPSEAPKDPPRRVLFVVVDTLRRNALSAYGAETPTPRIDAIGARGLRFDNAVASFHQTTMSMGALFTGKMPSLEAGGRRSVRWNGRNWCGMSRYREDTEDQACLPQTLTTLGERLKACGYRTVGIVSNELLHSPAGFERGFDAWVEVRPQWNTRPGNVRAPSPSAPRTMLVYAEMALREAADQDLFLYLHFLDVHDYKKRGYSYARSVEEFDATFGELLDQLEATGLLENTTVIVTSDHGEVLPGERYALETATHKGNPSFENVLQIPLLVSPAPEIDPSALVRTQDLFHLVPELAGCSGTPPDPMLGDDEIFLSERRYQTLRTGRWKSTRLRRDGTVALFDLDREDPETHDVARDHPDIVQAHEKRVHQLTRKTRNPGELPTSRTQEDIRRLRALGYLE